MRNQRTYRISYDDGVISGSGDPGWAVEDPIDSDNWQPIEAPHSPLAGIEVNASFSEDDVATAIRKLVGPREDGKEIGVIVVGDGWQRSL